MKKIVFLCVENSCRSQIAEAFTNIYGKEKVTSYSAGSDPSGNINKLAIKLMRERKYDLTKHQSISTSELPVMEVDTIVSMGCGDSCPSIKAKERIEWNIPDPKNMELVKFKEVIEEIRQNVLELLKTI